MSSTIPPEPPHDGGVGPETPTAPPPPEPTPVTALPWETPGYPALEALYETAKLVLINPSEAFARMSPKGDLGRPLLYAVIFGWIGVIAGQIYNLAFRSMIFNFIPGMPHGRELALGLVGNVAIMIFAPVLVLIGVFIAAAIYHLFLMMVGGNNEGFVATVRVVAYAGTTQILQVVPFCGGLIALVWNIVLEIIGLAKAHRTTQAKSAIAVLLPIVLCCACLAIVFAVSGAAIMAALGKAR